MGGGGRKERKQTETFLSGHMSGGCSWVCLGCLESSAACLSFFDLNRELGRQLSLSNACIAANQPSEPRGGPKELGVMVCT